MKTVRQLIQAKGRGVASVSPDAFVFEALELMARQEIGAVVVLEDDALVGLLSERDYARKVILVGRRSKDIKVHEIMNTPVTTVGPKTTIDTCMKHMTKRRCRHLPVVDDGKILGVVSIGDVVHWIILHHERTIHDLEDYITGEYPH